MQTSWLWIALLNVLLCIACVHASPGDADRAYRLCLSTCIHHGIKDPYVDNTCRPPESSPEDGGAGPASPASPGPLDFLAWKCEDKCRYHCMWHITERRTAQGLPVLKYHGKWPFVRVMGMQELLSSLFSLVNLAAHVGGLWLLHRRTRASLLAPDATQRGTAGTSRPSAAGGGGDDIINDLGGGFRAVAMFQDPARVFLARYTGWAALFCAGQAQMWLWSAIFHMRDVPVTEMLDYFGGNIAQAITLCVTLVRLLGVGTTPPLLLTAACAAVWVGTACHIWYMAAVHFDYGWNMVVMVTSGLASSVTSTVYLWAVGHPARMRYTATVVLIQLSLVLAAVDFPPLAGLLDAHASWHIVTPPLVISLYVVFAKDCEFLWQTRGDRLLQSRDSLHWPGIDDVLPVHARAKGKKLS
eukprot:jgi/Mesvir1/25401/Mv01438-RA.1